MLISKQVLCVGWKTRTAVYSTTLTDEKNKKQADMKLSLFPKLGQNSNCLKHNIYDIVQ